MTMAGNKNSGRKKLQNPKIKIGIAVDKKINKRIEDLQEVFGLTKSETVNWILHAYFKEGKK